MADSGGEGILEYAADGCAGKCFKCVWQCILQGSVRRYFCIWQIWQYGAYGYGKRDYPGKGGRKIGINRYTIEQTSRDNVETMQLSQNGENGSVLCRFITIHQENVEYEQYLYIGVTLKNTVDASFTYEKLIRQIMEEMQIDTEVNVNLKGQIHGALTDTQKEQFAQDMLDMMNAKLSVGRHMEDVYTVYAYNKGIKNYIMIGKDKVNVNICIGYDEEKK